MMNIEPANLADIPQLCDLLEQLFSEESEFKCNRDLQSEALTQIIESPNAGTILVLRDGSSIIGMVNLLFTISTALGGRVAILEDMVVQPARRGSRAGSTLMAAAINVARMGGCRRITLLTDRTNQPAQRFYLRHGFTFSHMIPLRLLLVNCE